MVSEGGSVLSETVSGRELVSLHVKCPWGRGHKGSESCFKYTVLLKCFNSSRANIRRFRYTIQRLNRRMQFLTGLPSSWLVTLSFRADQHQLRFLATRLWMESFLRFELQWLQVSQMILSLSHLWTPLPPSSLLESDRWSSPELPRVLVNGACGHLCAFSAVSSWRTEGAAPAVLSTKWGSSRQYSVNACGVRGGG